MKQDYICAGALTEGALTGAVSDFLYRVRPHRERLWDYYEGQQPVPKGEACILSSKNPWFCQSKFLGIATGIPW